MTVDPSGHRYVAHSAPRSGYPAQWVVRSPQRSRKLCLPRPSAGYDSLNRHSRSVGRIGGPEVSSVVRPRLAS